MIMTITTYIWVTNKTYLLHVDMFFFFIVKYFKKLYTKMGIYVIIKMYIV